MARKISQTTTRRILMTTKIISQIMTTDLMEVGGSSESDLIREKGYICIMQNA